jgi:3-phosphoshikimate 1-carboxyvinyltransferase
MVKNRIRLYFPKSVIMGTIHLDGSKSISNRALIMQALAGNANPQLDHLSTSVDTRLMQQLLMSREEVLDAGAAGTTFRFLTAYLATQERELVLTGSERMKQRPIGELVNTLNDLGQVLNSLNAKVIPPYVLPVNHWSRSKRKSG